MYNVIKRPIVTEKSSQKNDVGVYVFEINSKSNKIEVKNAIKFLYGADVESVRIIRLYKKTRLGKARQPMVKRSSYKKAIVKIKNGKTIDVNAFTK